MTPARDGPTVPGVNLRLRELPPVGRPGQGPPRALRAVGIVSLVVVVVSILTVPPRPGPSGDGPIVAFGLVLMVVGIAGSLRRSHLPGGVRLAALLMAATGTCVVTAVQPQSAAYAGIYYVVVVAGMRYEGPVGVAIAGVALVAESLVIGLTNEHASGVIPGLWFSVIPWFLVMRLVRRLLERGREAEALVEELRESRAAHAESVALAERSRVARDMHDVLAHSLSALALQLEGARLLARERGADDEVVASIERAHHLAASGLVEARQAIGALHGDDLPGPERLQQLADAFAEQSSAATSLRVTGEPHEHASDARLALYRTAQEALTNIRKHAAADRVEIKLDYEPGGTRLVVEDHGPGAPVLVGGGYGLSGMRERAELLGGRLTAGPAAGGGFEVVAELPTRIGGPA
jgi:signal transduction histidine kinase